MATEPDSGAEAPDDDGPQPEDEPPRPARKARHSAGVSNALGAVIAGLDEHILRGIPRAEVLVARGTQTRFERAGGGDLVIELPPKRDARTGGGCDEEDAPA